MNEYAYSRVKNNNSNVQKKVSPEAKCQSGCPQKIVIIKNIRRYNVFVSPGFDPSLCTTLNKW